MKIEMLICRAGPAGVDEVGDVIEVTAEEGKRMIEANQARPVVKKPKAETRKDVGSRKGKK